MYAGLGNETGWDWWSKLPPINFKAIYGKSDQQAVKALHS